MEGEWLFFTWKAFLTDNGISERLSDVVLVFLKSRLARGRAETTQREITIRRVVWVRGFFLHLRIHHELLLCF